MSTNVRDRVGSALEEIPHEEVAGMGLYRLGVFRGASMELVELRPGVSYPPHYHERSAARFYMILGEGRVILDGDEIRYRGGDSFAVPPGMRHGFEPEARTLFLAVQTPPIRDPQTGKEDLLLDHTEALHA